MRSHFIARFIASGGASGCSKAMWPMKRARSVSQSQVFSSRASASSSGRSRRAYPPAIQGRTPGASIAMPAARRIR